MNNKEIWKDIKDYEGAYEVSSLGRIKRLKRMCVRGGVENYPTTELILKTRLRSGYNIINLRHNSTTKTFTVHQLMAISFLNHTPNENKLVVDHIDNDRSNNKLSNLQLISHRENVSKDRKVGTSRYRGVYWNSQSKKWFSSIMIDNKRIYLGLFDCELKARDAYLNALKDA